MILAINTAFMTANLALCAKNKVVLKDLDANCKHSENVLKTIEQMCQEAEIDILDLTALAVVIGPGSFTGLRIGSAIAKALGCVNQNLKFVALSSLNLMAYTVVKNKLNEKEFVCVLNALSDLFFVGQFDKDGILLQEEQMINRQDFDSLKQSKFSLVGDLPNEHLHEIEISSEDLLQFALQQEKAGCFCQRKDVVPKYLRLSQAEDNLLKKIKNN